MKKVPNAVLQAVDGWWLCYYEPHPQHYIVHVRWVKGPYETPAKAAKALENWATECKTRAVG